jgi:hypothetical protein
MLAPHSPTLNYLFRAASSSLSLPSYTCYMASARCERERRAVGSLEPALASTDRVVDNL